MKKVSGCVRGEIPGAGRFLLCGMKRIIGQSLEKNASISLSQETNTLGKTGIGLLK